MPRDGAITFRDIVGKLAVLRITCDKCGRSGQYRVERLIIRYGIDAKLFDWSDQITADCPRKQARNLNDQCGARCPDLSRSDVRLRSILRAISIIVLFPVELTHNLQSSGFFSPRHCPPGRYMTGMCHNATSVSFIRLPRPQW